MKFTPLLEEKAHKDEVAPGILVHYGLILDERAKSLVTLRVPPTLGHFSIQEPLAFRERFLKKGSIWVVVERVVEGWAPGVLPVKVRGTGQPEWRKVKEIDGRVLVLEEALNFVPREGACVQLLRGLEWKYVNERDLDAHEKREGKYRLL
jgi:hypothetical protein